MLKKFVLYFELVLPSLVKICLTFYLSKEVT